MKSLFLLNTRTDDVTRKATPAEMATYASDQILVIDGIEHFIVTMADDMAEPLTPEEMSALLRTR